MRQPDPPAISAAQGLEAPGVLDALLYEEKADRVVLAMFERRPWTGGDQQLWQLQEKLNAYASFALDGELAESHPDLACKPVCIQLRTVHAPDRRALAMLDQVRRQLGFQHIALEIWQVAGEEPDAPQ